MRNDTETRVIDRSKTTGKRRLFNPLACFIAIAAIIVVCIAIGVARKANREKTAGGMEAAYIPRPVENGGRGAAPTLVKRKHVIFRLGDYEIFRFTYEDSDEDMRYSFEVGRAVYE